MRTDIISVALSDTYCRDMVGYCNRLSLTANDIDEKSLKRIFDQISRDVPVGRAQHKDDRALVEAALPFEARLLVLTEKHPQLLKVFGKFSHWISQMGTLGGYRNHSMHGDFGNYSIDD